MAYSRIIEPLNKELLIKTIQALPDTATTEDLIERILLLEAIGEGRAQLRAVEGVASEDIDKHLPQQMLN